MTQIETNTTPSASVPKKTGNRRGRPEWGDLKVLLWCLAWVLLIEAFALILWALSVGGAQENGKALSFFAVLGVATICSGAASLVGGLLGFLFGIPRSTESTVNRTRLGRTSGTSPDAVASDAAAAPASPAPTAPATAERPPQLRVNTNLEDISDGITKVLLGAGLAQANQIVRGAVKLAVFLGPSFGPDASGQAVAIATIIYGLLGGFFAGYLATRLYLTAAFERADPH